MEASASWATEELQGIDLGDVRLDQRCEKLLSTLSSQPKKSIPQACKGWAETLAAYRFFNNERVSPDKILLPHKKATLKRIQQEKVVLNVQDTTEINFSHRSPIEGMGKLSRDFEQGFHLHPTLAITPNKVCLGVVHAKSWVREVLGQKANRHQKKIEEKESFRWIESYHVSNEIAKQCPNTFIVNVADREGDIYELFLEKEKDEDNKAHWLVRASHDRRLLDPDTEELLDERLFEKTRMEPVHCEYSFTLPVKGSQKSRNGYSRIYQRRWRIDSRNGVLKHP